MQDVGSQPAQHCEPWHDGQLQHARKTRVNALLGIVPADPSGTQAGAAQALKSALNHSAVTLSATRLTTLKRQLETTNSPAATAWPAAAALLLTHT